MAAIPVLIDTDVNQIIADLKAAYELETGRTLQPAQTEMLLINNIAFREKLVRESIQAAGLQMLVNFATGVALDQLGALVGVTRLPASSASTQLVFSITQGHNGVVIPANTRVSSTDNKINFATQEAISVAVGETSKTISVFATTTGEVGNDYSVGSISTILDPLPYLLSASNLEVTAGGADSETDLELRERIKKAPNQFSVAGPTGAYEFFTKSASSSIIDVKVTSPTPGAVFVYPLIEGEQQTPLSVLQLVDSVLNDETVKPLTDTVTVISPTLINYDIEIEAKLYTNTDPVLAASIITEKLNEYKTNKAQNLGQDIKRDQLIALSIYDLEKVFDITVVSPATDIVVEETEIAICGSVTFTITGFENG